jgi:hypothetical protein
MEKGRERYLASRLSYLGHLFRKSRPKSERAYLHW